MKKFKKVLLVTFVSIALSFVFVDSMKVNINYAKKEENLINISECSAKFMKNYFQGLSEIKEDSNKENILIVTSETKIKDNKGASKIIEAPNNQYILQYDTKEEKNKALEALAESNEIISVEENIKYKIMDTNYNSWGIEKIGLDHAIENAYNKELNDVTVAIIDTGCDMELFNKYYPGKIVETYNVLDNEVMNDTDGHGTHIAGTIAEGTPSNVKILPIKTSYDGYLYNLDIIEAINYIVYNKKADVINMSFGSYESSASISQAIDAAKSENIICVVAAGNDNTSEKSYPAAYDTTMSIAACDSRLNKSFFSNYGPTITFTAPGESILSINGIMSGTSMAAPHAVCATAVLKSYNIDYTLEEIIEILKTYAIDIGDPGRDNYFGYGLINFLGVKYCDCSCEICDSIYCSDCDCKDCIFKEEINIIQEIKVVNQTVTSYNYGSFSNLSNVKVKIYYDDENYIIKDLLDLEDCEIIGYDPYCYTSQTITIRYNGRETSFKLNVGYEYESGWEYDIINEEEKTIKLTNCKIARLNNGNFLNKIYIPEKIDGYTVKSLGEELFYQTVIEKVVLPETVTEIGKKAFYKSGLKKIDIKSNNISIGDYAFYELENIETINSNITALGAHAFEGCLMLKDIRFAETLETIGINAFWKCSNLENITIPESVKTIGANAFGFCNIKNINIPSKVSKIEKETFTNCFNLESVTIPESIVHIGDYAFSYCTNLRNIYIPKSIESIGKCAFMGCAGVESIIVDKENNKYDSRKNCNAIIETATNTLLVGAYNTVIPDTVKIIGAEAFAENSLLTQMIIPDSVEEIQYKAFYNCDYLEEIRIPRSVIKIGNYVFGDYTTIWVYKDSYAKTYAEQNEVIYKCIDASEIFVRIPKKEYRAFETVDDRGMYIVLVYDDGRRDYIEDEITIKYKDENTSFRYGDTYFTVVAYSNTGEYIEKQVDVTVLKATPEYILPSDITAKEGQKLSEIELPIGFEWMNETQVIQGAGNIIFKAKYVPSDTNNYEIVENIDIVVLVKSEKRLITPNIIIKDKIFDGKNIVDIDNIIISNLENTDYIIQSIILDSVNVGRTIAKVKLKLTDDKFKNYALENGKQENEYNIEVTILPAKVEKPVKAEKTYIYNGKEQKIELLDFDNSKMSIEGNVRKNAGEQVVTISLISENYVWKDNTTDDIMFNFIIEKADANIKHNSSDSSYKYDGKMHSITLNIISPNSAKVKFMDQYGNYTLDEMPRYIDVGIYTIKYRIFIDDNYKDVFGQQTLEIYAYNSFLFTDISEKAWYYNAVKFNYEKGMIKGTTDATFDPNGDLTRGMLVTILWRMEGNPKVTTNQFTDVGKDVWYSTAVNWAANNRIVSGYGNGKFGPNDKITREQLAVMLRNYAIYKKKDVSARTDLSKFADNKYISSYAKDAVSWAVANKIISGKSEGTRVDPHGKATRAEAAAMLYNYCMNVK